MTIFRTALLFALGGALGLLWGCGPIYGLRYEYKKPANAERSCFAQCLTGRSLCRRLERLEGELNRREFARCQTLASRGDDADYAKRLAECRFAVAPPPAYSGTECELDYNACFVACGGTVIKIRECVVNCDAE